MKVLFQSRVDLYNPRGGDTSQMEYTKIAVEKINPSIQIDIRPEIKVKDIGRYDIIHLFNLDWVCETYLQAKWAKENGKQVVLSAIHHSEDEVKRFENEARYDIRRLYNAVVLSQAVRDVGKNFYRSFFNSKKLYPTLFQSIMGIRNQQKKIIQMSNIVLVQTKKEVEDIRKDFEIKDFKWKKVVNGVNVDVFGNPSRSPFQKLFMEEFDEDISKFDLILNVGRIEPRKNQLKLIEAFELLQDSKKFIKNYKLVFIGSFTERSSEYIWRFKNAVKNNPDIYHIKEVPQEIIASAMGQNGVYVHPSWFETTGLVSLEASLAGMPVVVCGERIKEYLGDYAFYCDPGNVDSIKDAILKANTSTKKRGRLQDEIGQRYNWAEAAKQTIAVYDKILSGA